MYIVPVYAQEETIILSDSLFNTKNGFDFSDVDGWVFHADCGQDLAIKELDTRSWEKLKPSQLSTGQTDSSGSACGWFRIKVQLDDKFATKPLGLMNLSWMATDLYIDGEHIQSFGRTGHLGKAFVGNKRNKSIPLLASLHADSTYVIAIRVVDPRPVTPEQLKSAKVFTDWRRILYLTNSPYVERIFNHNINIAFHDGLTISVTAVLSLLFWVIYLLNPSEKNIRRFAIGATSLALLCTSIYIKEGSDVPYQIYAVVHFFALFCVIFFICYIPVILAGVFNKTMPKWVQISLGVLSVVIFVLLYFGQEAPFIGVAILPISFSLYYLYSSIRHLSKAQVSVVIGFSISVIFIIVFMIASAQGNGFPLTYSFIYTVASPLGMLGYVAFRFKEMITEVQVSAGRIVALSEEKRIQAENQQVVLQREVEKQTKDLKDTLDHLQETQQQLIHSEKMASLGELTAGIAHEIQNPLNFVKNFSEVSVDLLDELKIELQEENKDEVGLLANDVTDNLKKIIHHGNRADSIVKGMLLHSRSGTGAKEPTDINALVDEYLRLGYHGLRAKDKTFNATLRTDYDTSVGQLIVAKQDMGRVLLNLIANAFYATHDKKGTAYSGYVPTVGVRTSVAGEGVRIEVSDNGNGIADEVKEKIFQPFFTTKPTGEGTGLGLSIAFDVVKSHGGQLGVESTVGEGTTFFIVLPLQ